MSYVKEAAEEAGVSHQYIHSGAGHDAQFASYMLPTTMIFVQSKDGLSHCEPEYSSPDQSGIDESIFVETDEKLRGKYIANFLRRVPVTGVLEPWDTLCRM